MNKRATIRRELYQFEHMLAAASFYYVLPLPEKLLANESLTRVKHEKFNYALLPKEIAQTKCAQVLNGSY